MAFTSLLIFFEWKRIKFHSINRIPIILFYLQKDLLLSLRKTYYKYPINHVIVTESACFRATVSNFQSNLRPLNTFFSLCFSSLSSVPRGIDRPLSPSSSLFPSAPFWACVSVPEIPGRRPATRDKSTEKGRRHSREPFHSNRMIRRREEGKKFIICRMKFLKTKEKLLFISCPHK